MPRLFKVGIYTGCLVLLIYLAFRLYIRDVTFLIPFILGLVFVCVSLLGLVIWLFVRPSFSKFREAAISLLVVALTVFLPMSHFRLLGHYFSGLVNRSIYTNVAKDGICSQPRL
jgi:chromate transport protein ChrA